MIRRLLHALLGHTLNEETFVREWWDDNDAYNREVRCCGKVRLNPRIW